ncbi:MAG: competence protein ComEA [Ilumatobacteraceae bacterium]|jgi:competence protein ComEA
MDSSLPRPAPPRSPLERAREWIVWFGPGRLAATALAVLAVVAGGMWLLKGSPGRAEDQLPFATHSASTTVASAALPTTTTAAAVVVYVTGAVTVPGVYTLALPARVTDAVAAAGGAGAQADLNVVNLAAALHDGERVYVPKVGEVVPAVIGGQAGSETIVPAGPINVNSATADQLDVLPGVGPATAAAIVAHREQHGPFQSVDELGDVRGIGPSKLDALRGLVTV